MGTTYIDVLTKSSFEYTTQIFLFLGIFIAFAVKTPTVFLNSWLLKAHVESPLGGSIVLAGIPMLVLNLAVCWKHLYRSISRKLLANLSYFNDTLREGDILKLENIGGNVYIDEEVEESNIELSRIPRGHTLNITNFSSYLAGLIEGDGCIYIPKSLIGAAKVIILFNSKDLPLALLVQKALKCGNITKVKGKNAYELTIGNLEGLKIVVNFINGYMRTPKILKLYELIDWINLKIKNKGKYDSSLLNKLPLDNSSLASNAWLAGFIEADGCFYVRITKNKNCATHKVACLLELAQKTSEGRPMLEIMTKIGEFLSVSVTFRDKSNQYWVRTSSFTSNKILVLYLKKYPIFSSKHLDFLSWKKVLNIMIEKKQVNKLEEIKKIKNNMNSKRTLFNWDHLKDFYF